MKDGPGISKVRGDDELSGGCVELDGPETHLEMPGGKSNLRI